MKTRYNWLLILAFFSCTASKQPGSQQPITMPATADTFDTQGHRGCRGLMPENTIPAMKLALDLGVTTLEMDAVITADKQILLSHEPFFNHEISTAPGGAEITEANEKQFNIYRMTYAETRAFDVGLKPHPRFPKQRKMAAVKPLLADVFDSVSQYMKTAKRAYPYFNIETKSSPAGDGIFHPAPEEFVDLLVKLIREKKMEEQVIIQSFDFRTLKYLHEKYPRIKTALLIESFDIRGLDAQLTELGFTPTIYSPAYQLVTAAMIKTCHEKNMKIIPWTVNSREKIESLKALGVDGIISDYPDLFMPAGKQNN